MHLQGHAKAFDQCTVMPLPICMNHVDDFVNVVSMCSLKWNVALAVALCRPSPCHTGIKPGIKNTCTVVLSDFCNLFDHAVLPWAVAPLSVTPAAPSQMTLPQNLSA